VTVQVQVCLFGREAEVETLRNLVAGVASGHGEVAGRREPGM